jgi:protein-tyrosine phosphatase
MPDAPRRRGRIDTHGHLLPNLDDGSRSLRESLAIAQRMYDAGYDVLTCSPHVWPNSQHTPAFIRDHVAALQMAVDEAGIPIRLVPGGELNITELDVFSIPDAEIVTYGLHGKYVLFDFWADELPGDFWERIARLQSAGLTCVQAHPERIAAFQDRPLVLDEMAERGVLLQCNLHCLTDLGGARAKRSCEQWLKDGRYFMFGSDLHRLDTIDVRLKGLARAIELLGEATVDRLTIENPAKALGLSVPSPGTPGEGTNLTPPRSP